MTGATSPSARKRAIAAGWPSSTAETGACGERGSAQSREKSRYITAVVCQRRGWQAGRSLRTWGTSHGARTSTYYVRVCPRVMLVPCRHAWPVSRWAVAEEKLKWPRGGCARAHTDVRLSRRVSAPPGLVLLCTALSLSDSTHSLHSAHKPHPTTGGRARGCVSSECVYYLFSTGLTHGLTPRLVRGYNPPPARAPSWAWG